MSRAIVLSYLDAMEARALDRAQALLAPGFTMTFPGARRFDSLAAMIDWSRGRYRFVKKSYDGFDEYADVVYCYGTLDGEALDGRAIAGVRFVDRFKLERGLIADQQVWNDLAEFQ